MSGADTTTTNTNTAAGKPLRGQIDYVIFDMDGLLSELAERLLADGSVSTNLSAVDG